MKELSPDELGRLTRHLHARRAELLALGESTRSSRAPVTLDQSSVGRLSRMEAIQGQQMAPKAERRRQREIERIDAALARLVADEYGWCANCGEPIGLARLTIDPTTPCCIHCASR